MSKRKWKSIAALVSAFLGVLANITFNPTAFKISITALAESLFWIGLLQIDSMFWFYTGYEKMKKIHWIPELKISAKDSFIIFCGAIIFGFHALLILLILSI